DDVYTPLGQEATQDSGLLDRGNHNGLAAVGRLKPGTTLSVAANELTVLGAALTKTYPRTNSDTRPEIMSMTERMVGSVAPTLRMLFAAVGFLLLLAAVNVANLLVARGATRRHELAVRAALGCTRWGLARQQLAESLILGLAGGAGGLALAAGLVKVLVAT